MGDNATEIDLDSVIDRLLEGAFLLLRSSMDTRLSILHIPCIFGGTLLCGLGAPWPMSPLSFTCTAACFGFSSTPEGAYATGWLITPSPTASGWRHLKLVVSVPIFSKQTSFNKGIDVLTKFCPVRGNRPGKPVQLQEYEIKYLCTKAREIFINQPILLELEAPIKICGTS